MEVGEGMGLPVAVALGIGVGRALASGEGSMHAEITVAPTSSAAAIFNNSLCKIPFLISASSLAEFCKGLFESFKILKAVYGIRLYMIMGKKLIEVADNYMIWIIS